MNRATLHASVFGIALGIAVTIGSGVCLAADDWPSATPLKAAADDQAGALPPSVSAELVRPGQWLCTFRVKPDGNPGTLTLAGSFNTWNREATPMKRQGQGAGQGGSQISNLKSEEGAWSVQVELPAGVHLYKFVADGNRWFPDPQSPESVPDGQSGQNSVLRLGRIANLKEGGARTGDGQIEVLALEHDRGRPLYFQVLADGKALFRLRTLANDAEHVWVATKDGGLTEMYPVAEMSPFTLWEAIADEFSESPARGEEREWQGRDYTFILADGALRGSGPEIYGGTLLRNDDVFRTPDWAKHAIWYQVFLDRFRNGDASNDRQPVRPWTSDWFTPSEWEGKDGQTFYKFFVFDRQYGGDIAGLEEKLPYLKDLGVNAIYLNPIFKAESNHKYNSESYVHVDDHFGTLGDYDAVVATEDHNDPSTWKWTESDKRFLKFLKTAHAQGFKVIIDGVFNHVGTAHPAFQDVKKNGKKSRYADWFNITSWDPFKYEGWFGLDALPVFKKSKDGLASEQVKQYIFNVTRRWLDPDGDGDPSDGIDGWRLDVPNEIPAPFWVEWRKVVKSANPSAYITGEIWQRGDEWLDGRHFDAVMNYEFARAVVAWVFDQKHKITPSEFDRRLRELRLAYPLEVTLVLQNLMDSHDTDRIASMALNPDRAYDNANRAQDNGPNYNNAKPGPEEYRKARLAALLQMTYVGAPMVYYGDEVGMWGSDDPTCRKPMLWEDLQPYDKPEENFVMRDQLAYYRQIIALRNAHPALRTGSIQTLLADDEEDVWAFLRTDRDEQLVVIANSSSAEREVTVPLPLTSPNPWKGVFGSEGNLAASEHKLRVRVPAVSGVVLHSATPK